MKKVFGVIVALFLTSSVFSQGIAFEHGTYAEALAKAKKENKMVFMDCYTTWCGPCKMLAKNIFPQKEVGDFFNKHYVSVKMDMEKGEGIELMKKYEVKAFPTLLFLDDNGVVLHKMVGGSDAAGLIGEAKAALDPNQRIGALDARYAKGERGVKFVAKYIQALQKAYNEEKMAQVGKEFIENTPVDQLCNEDAFTILSCGGTEYNSKSYQYLIANKVKFIDLVGEESFAQVIGSAINNHLNAFAATSTLEGLKSEIENTKKDFVTPNQVMMEKNLMSQYYLSHKEFGKWFDEQIAGAKEALKTDKRMGSSILINTTYRVAMDPAFEGAGLYGKAITAVEDYLKEDGEMLAGYYCLASLYKKDGNKEKALENINVFMTKNAAAGRQNDSRVEQFKQSIESM
ncbi:thioredoxin family protein [Marinifilum sp. RC60d5]|uniref:thioredoxin family protein n=1 Tax=Marinifilum sp. RC60d5 TaxID=3458414 RepID=UPI004036D40A